MQDDRLIFYTFNLTANVTLEMLPIRAGEFMMGSPKGETGCKMPDETQHHVTITAPYWMGKYSVTQEQYKAVMNENPSEFKTGPDHPVECVSYHEANEFCRRLNRSLAAELPAGYRFALPTEAQWEYACRAGSSSALYTGEELTNANGVCRSLESIAWYESNHTNWGHLPVGGKAPNAWGLYDMIGNIHEWVYDRYGVYPADGAVDPQGPDAGPERVVRGGSWRSQPWKCRAARRGVDAPGYKLNGLGFRVALVERDGRNQ